MGTADDSKNEEDRNISQDSFHLFSSNDCLLGRLDNSCLQKEFCLPNIRIVGASSIPSFVIPTDYDALD